MLRSLTALMLLALASCATPAPRPAQPDIYVMRHLHTPKGATNPALTDEGQRYAKILVEALEDHPPSIIFVSNTLRAQQTAAQVAARYKIVPRVYDPADTPGLIAALSAVRGTVLVVGHSNTVPDIVERLSGERPGPLVHEDFGDIWHYRGPGRPVVHTRLVGG